MRGLGRMLFKMATKEEKLLTVVELKKEVERLRESEKKLKYKEICCQKVKERFLKNSKENQFVKEKQQTIALKEYEENVQFLEIRGLLSDIKKLQKQCLMLQHQLHCELNKQEVEVLNDILYKDSELFLALRTGGVSVNDDMTPLAFWYSEMIKTVACQQREEHKGKLSKKNQLFYNISYKNGSKEPRDMQAELIFKKKIKREQGKNDPVEALNFSTSYKGFCVQIVITRTANYSKRYQDEKLSDTEFQPYHCSSDIQVDQLQEHLLKELLIRNSPHTFVQEHVWNKLEKFVT